MAREREAVSQMMGACLREVAELVLVFGFLDIVLAEKTFSVGRLTLSVWVSAVFFVLFAAGVAIERFRKE